MAFQATAEDIKIGEYLMQFYSDPLGHVMASYPWGCAGTILEKFDGPDTWQTKFLMDLGRHVAEREDGLISGIKMAVASGWGIGKTTLVSWVIRWYCDTRPYPQLVVTANTANQLSTKTWRELAKWNNVAINGHLWDWTATSYKFKASPETWFASAIPWSDTNPQAFAGTHEQYVMMLFDEASTISDKIWNEAMGIFNTKGEAILLAFGNPSQNTGRFHTIFNLERELWDTRSIDARDSKITNKEELEARIKHYGIDHDIVRVSVLGKFPKQSSLQFIPTDKVEAAMARENGPDTYKHAAKVIGADVARFGDDATVFCLRQGLKVLKMKHYTKLDVMETAQLLARFEDEENPDAVFADVGGLGGGVIDRGRQLGRQWIEYNASHASARKGFANKRAECWGNVLEWLELGDLSALSKEDKDRLLTDLTGPMYGTDNRERILLEKKEDMKKRDLASPDYGDALSITFTQKVIPKHMLQDDYDYEEAERARRKATRTRNKITGY